MSVTGIVLFVIFLLVKSLLDKKKREARRQKLPETSALPADEMGGTTGAPQVMAENPAEMRDLLRRFLGGRVQQMEEESVPQEAAAAVETMSGASALAASRHVETMREELREVQESAQSGALALDFAPPAMLQAVVLAEVIGRPKAQRRRSPYFRL